MFTGRWGYGRQFEEPKKIVPQNEVNRLANSIGRSEEKLWATINWLLNRGDKVTADELFDRFAAQS